MGDEVKAAPRSGDKWLRSPGNDADYASNVNNDGNVNRNGNNVDNDNDVVRPDLGYAPRHDLCARALPDAVPAGVRPAHDNLKGTSSPPASASPHATGQARENTERLPRGTAAPFPACGPAGAAAPLGRATRLRIESEEASREIRDRHVAKRNERPPYLAPFDEAMGFAALFAAHGKARRCKLYKREVALFEMNLGIELARLQRELLDGNYKTLPYRSFEVFEPKRRAVHALQYRDRVVQHALCDNIVEPWMERHLVYDNAASRKGKGTQFARDRLCGFLREHYRAHAASGWILKYDVRHFFDSVDHQVLWQLVKPAFSYDERVQRLIYEFIVSYRSGPRRGLPLGNQTSSWFALYYLDGLDRLVKEKLRVKHYTRYMDDGVLVHESRDYLRECLAQMRDFVRDERRLEFNDKTQIVPLSQGVDYLGWHFRLTESGKVVRKLRTANKQRMKRRLHRLRSAVEAGNLEASKALEIELSYLNYLKYGDTYALRSQMAGHFVLRPGGSGAGARPAEGEEWLLW